MFVSEPGGSPAQPEEAAMVPLQPFNMLILIKQDEIPTRTRLQVDDETEITGRHINKKGLYTFFMSSGFKRSRASGGGCTLNNISPSEPPPALFHKQPGLIVAP